MDAARAYVLEVRAFEIFPIWQGTGWSYSGTTRIPGEGRIACGYFVTNTLTDVGFDIPRVKWAQLPSESMIKAMTKGKGMQRFSNQSMAKVMAAIEESGEGLYVVGLDSHTGFVVFYKGQMRFVHSSYYIWDWGVTSQGMEEKSPLKDSKYRVVGKVLGDEMMREWQGG